MSPVASDTTAMNDNSNDEKSWEAHFTADDAATTCICTATKPPVDTEAAAASDPQPSAADCSLPLTSSDGPTATASEAGAGAMSSTNSRKRLHPAITQSRADHSTSGIRISLLHSEKYTQVLHAAMSHIHQDRDVLLASLLHCCGFLRQTPRFFTVVEPRRATRAHLESFHDPSYLDLLEYTAPSRDDAECSGQLAAFQSNDRSADHLSVLDSYGLTEDCHLPTDPRERATLWRYCQYVAGASLHAANLLVTDSADVVINWGGGRHHAHSDRAGGFCYVNDVVLAIQYLIKSSGSSSSKNGASSDFGRQRRKRRVLYLDIDIHHADGLQAAFYDTDQVLTVSFHRRVPGFFPPTSGCPSEKGRSGTPGVGYNLNLNLPRECTDQEFVSIYTHAIRKLIPSYDPDYVVLCVGADGVKGDPVVGGEGWHLSPEGLAECVRLTAQYCAGVGSAVTKRKLLLVGAGGYDPVKTARTFLICTAGACEGARPGMLWNELPKDVPQHGHFARYGPEFELLSSIASSAWNRKEHSDDKSDGNTSTEESKDGSLRKDDGRMKLFQDVKKAVGVTSLFVQSRREEALVSSSFNANIDVSSTSGNSEDWEIPTKKKKKNGGGGRRRKKKKAKSGPAVEGGES